MAVSAGYSGLPVFVVHRHLAHQLHYDFRMEAGGKLKSWALPKGPSMNPKDKRLAIRVEDHSLDYKDFAGVIPEGYGAGIVEIWDKGRYELEGIETKDISGVMKRSLASGHVSFILKGRKLKGKFALVRTGSKNSDAWLLIKQHDKFSTGKKYEAEYYTPASSRINVTLTKREGSERFEK